VPVIVVMLDALRPNQTQRVKQGGKKKEMRPLWTKNERRGPTRNSISGLEKLARVEKNGVRKKTKPGNHNGLDLKNGAQRTQRKTELRTL